MKYINDETEPECEGLSYAFISAYETKSGRDMPASIVTRLSEPSGELWTEDQLATLYPELTAHYGFTDGA